MIDNDEQERLDDLKKKYEACFDEVGGRRKISEELKIEIVKFSEKTSKTRKELAKIIGIKFPNDISVWKRKYFKDNSKNIQVIDKLGVNKQKTVQSYDKKCFVRLAKEMNFTQLMESFGELKKHVNDIAQEKKSQLDELNDLLKS